MGQVGLQYRVLPESTEIDLVNLQDSIRGALPEGAELKAAETKPVAFGLKALHLLIVMEDKQGGVDTLEQAIAGVQGVQSVEILQMGLL
jgi:elongation factor 1-beta